MSKTKIVCTIGPACADVHILSRMIHAGMSVARFNFSHGGREAHAEMIRMVRTASEETGVPVAILQDLRGPKIRVGEVEAPGIHLKTGETLVLTTDAEAGQGNRVSVSYPHLPEDVSVGDTILLADGLMEMVVTRTTKTEVHCEVISGGTLTSHKGINLPSGSVRTPAITEKDKGDLAFGLSQDVDYVAMSFVRRSEDVRQAKEIIAHAGHSTPVIAKIEKHEALKDIDNIMDVSDGIMVARGDLGVEIPLENVPGTQKMLVEKGNEAGKPVIIATQMLRSMLDSPRPTRAEATDVANAVLDGADALMLSEETATGNHPVRAVEYMGRIAKVTEEKYPYEKSFQEILQTRISESVAHATCILSDHLAARAIIATTKSGYTAHQIARFRPKSRIIAVSPDIRTVRQLALYWGCLPGLMDYTKDTDEMFDRASEFAIEKGHAKKGDLVVITAGHPMWEAGTTNMITVRRLGDIV
ncbi:MAG: pyruvate kinase [Desulfosalsimonas sp.]|uniref:pyruvate kinase n=1 Tax=Desulfosalsimonas sp. TaxID=3073848 RepID=UPI0039705E5E